jgi:hypothetical protein
VIRFQAAPKGPVAAPKECLDLWNAAESHAFPDDGKHFYVDHKARQAWVFRLADGTNRCAVIIVVATSDWEYGLDGEVGRLDGAGWRLMNSVFPNVYTMQARAAERANASLDPNGKLAQVPGVGAAATGSSAEPLSCRDLNVGAVHAYAIRTNSACS